MKASYSGPSKARPWPGANAGASPVPTRPRTRRAPRQGTSAGAPGRGLCGNCVDDNHDGLGDWEDPQCCAQPMALAVDRVRLRLPPAPVHGDRLRLQAIYSEVTPALFDPLKQDTSLQLSDASGPLFCTTIPAGRFRRTHRLVFAFTDPAARSAGGLESGEFRIN